MSSEDLIQFEEVKINVDSAQTVNDINQGNSKTENIQKSRESSKHSTTKCSKSRESEYDAPKYYPPKSWNEPIQIEENPYSSSNFDLTNKAIVEMPPKYLQNHMRSNSTSNQKVKEILDKDFPLMENGKKLKSKPPIPKSRPSPHQNELDRNRQPPNNSPRISSRSNSVNQISGNSNSRSPNERDSRSRSNINSGERPNSLSDSNHSHNQNNIQRSNSHTRSHSSNSQSRNSNSSNNHSSDSHSHHTHSRSPDSHHHSRHHSNSVRSPDNHHQRSPSLVDIIDRKLSSLFNFRH